LIDEELLSTPHGELETQLRLLSCNIPNYLSTPHGELETGVMV
jgi:hypothetical protein